MRSFWSDAVVVAGVLVATPLGAQSRVEWQAHGMVTAGDPAFAGGGLGVGLRLGGRAALWTSASAGTRDGAVAGRGELLAVFEINPPGGQGVVVYGAGGAAVVVGEGPTREWIVVALGVQAARRRQLAWFVEAGVGGGLRGALGVRVRAGGRP